MWNTLDISTTSTFFRGSVPRNCKDHHHLNLPPLGGGLVHGGGRHGDVAADPLGDAGGAIYSTGTETIDDHQGSAHQGEGLETPGTWGHIMEDI